MSDCNKKYYESAWELIFLLKENGHLKDTESMMLIHRYFLECCRRIWILLPDSGSKKGVEAAEKYCSGEISWDEAYEVDWYSEASAFLFEQRKETDLAISHYIDEVKARKGEIGSMLVPPREIASSEIKDLLTDAAYFANKALNFPFVSGGTRESRKDSMRNIGKFLPLDLFNTLVPETKLKRYENRDA